MEAHGLDNMLFLNDCRIVQIEQKQQKTYNYTYPLDQTQ